MGARLILPAVTAVLAGLAGVAALAETPPSPRPRPTAPRAAPRPTPPPALEGTVRGPDGKPIEKALVVAMSTAGLPGDIPVSTRTNAQGRFNLILRSRAKHMLRAEAAGLAGRTLRDVVPGAPLTIDLVAGGTIEGVVRDGETGQPAPGIRVGTRDSGAIALAGDPDAGRIQATTDADGRFRLTGLAPGRHDVSARARGRGYASRNAVPLGARIEMLLQPAATLFGSVRGPDGKPLAGAVVTPLAMRGKQGPRSEKTDEQGRYEVAGLEPGLYDVAVRAEGLAPGVVSDVVLEASGEAHVDVALQPGTRVTGRLVDANDKALAGRVSIGELAGHPVPYVLLDLLRAEAGADGRFAIDAVPVGAHAMGADAPGRAPKRVELEVSATQRAVDLGDVRMEAGLVIRGRVRTAAGDPIPNAYVQGHGVRTRSGRSPMAHTDADGLFAMGGLEPVTYRLFAGAPGFSRAEATVEPGSDAVEIVLDTAGRISGKVVDERGAAVESFSVVARPVEDGAPSAFERFESTDGRFELESVSPGAYAVTVEAPDHAPAIVSAKVAAAGGTDVGTVKLSPGGTVRGTVVDTGGAFVGGARITLTKTKRDRITTTFEGEPEILTDRSGAFEAKGVAEGSFEVTASHPDYARSLPVLILVEANRPTHDLRVVLSQGGRIEGSYRRRDGAPVPGAFVVATPLREESWRGGPLVPVRPDGTFTIEHVPPGRVRVTTMTNAGTSYRSAQARETDVRDGETATLDIVNREILLSGRVTRAGGPAAGLRMEAHTGGGATMFSGRGQAVPRAMGGLERMNAVTHEDGTFEMLVDEPGALRMTIWSADQRFHLPARTIEVPDADAFSVELSFDGVPVNGIVVDKDTDAPIPYARVTASSREPGRNVGVQAEAGPDGRFLFEIEPGEYMVGGFDGQGDHAHDSLRVTVGSSGVADVRIALARGLRITGRVLDPAGRAVPSVRLNAYAFPEGSMGSTETLADGSFEIRGLRNVDHRLTAWADTGFFAIRPKVGAGTLDMALRLQEAGRIVVQVVTADGQPVAGVSPRVINIDGAPNVLSMGVCKALTDAQGTTELLAPGGRLALAADKGTLSGFALVEVESGATASARITVKDKGQR